MKKKFGLVSDRPGWGESKNVNSNDIYFDNSSIKQQNKYQGLGLFDKEEKIDTVYNNKAPTTHELPCHLKFSSSTWL